MSSDLLDAYRGQNDLVTLLPAGALTSRPNVYETVWGRAFLRKVGHEVPEIDPVSLGTLLNGSGETPLWQAYYACVASGDPSTARGALDSTQITEDAVEGAESALLSAVNSPDPGSSEPNDARALDAIAAIEVLGCLEGEDVGDRVEPVRRLVDGTGEARLAFEVQLQEALAAGPSDALVSDAPVPAELTQECVAVDAFAAAAAVELGRAQFDEVAECLTPYSTQLADTQVLYRLSAADAPEAWRRALVDANLADVVSRVQENGLVVGRSNDYGSAGSTLTALRLLRLAGNPDEPVPSWLGDGLDVELDRVAGASDPLEADLVRHACVLAKAECADPAAHRARVREALEQPGSADGRRETYALMAYELGLQVDLDGEVDAVAALRDRALVCVASTFELADPGATGVEGIEGAWDAMVDYLAEGDVIGASCASWLWRAGSGGNGGDTDRELRQVVEENFHVGDDGLWRSDLSSEGDLALSLYLYQVIGLA